MEIQNSRDLALSVLNRKADNPGFSGGTLDELFRSGADLTQRDRAFLNHLVQGVFRWRLRLDWIIEQNSHFPLRKIDLPVLNILRIAVYQIFFMDRVPESAAVNEAVRQARRIGPRHIVSFVNGLLRNICRNKEKIRMPDRERDPDLFRSVSSSYPSWLVKMWDRDWGVELTDRLLSAGNELPRITFRVNAQKTDRNTLLARLADEGVQCSPAAYSPDGISTDDFRGRIDRLESFKDGLLQVQDEAAQVCAYLLDPRPGERVLDVCAGFGGKASHIAERIGDGGMIAALDISFRRLVNLRDNAARLGIRSIHPAVADGSRDMSRLFKNEWDRILVDAPCSGLGVISRHPDIKWNRKEEDLKRLAHLQGSILKEAFPLLRKGGTVLYVTCTLSREENEGVVESLLADHADAQLVDLRSRVPDWCADLIDGNGFFRTFPHMHKMDGFFGALIQRRKAHRA
jgi:16S rRNA (cytosine967-C5)-methyltransferase